MRKHIFLLWCGFAFLPGQALAQQTAPSAVNGGIYNATPPTLSDKQRGVFQLDANGNLKTTATVSPSGTQDINIKQVQGAVPSATNPLWVSPATASTPWATTLPTTPTIAAGNGAVVAPSSESLAALAPVVSTAAESNHVLKSGAGNLYGLTVTIGATTGYLMIFDATALPSNGAVTPKYCYPIISNGTTGGASLSWPVPARFATGITAGFSTTGCFNLTASATGNFFGQVD